MAWGYQGLAAWGYQGLMAWGYQGLMAWGYQGLMAWGYQGMAACRALPAASRSPRASPFKIWYCGIIMKRFVPEPHTESAEGRRLLALLMRDDVFTRLILDADEVCAIVPEARAMICFDQCNPHHPYDAWVHTAHSVASAAPVPILRLALLMHDLGKPGTFYLTEDEVGHFNRHERKGEEIVRTRLSKLGFDEDTVETVAALVCRHDVGIAETEIGRLLNELGAERLLLLLDVKEADARSHDAKYKNQQLARVEMLRQTVKTSCMKVDGCSIINSPNTDQNI